MILSTAAWLATTAILFTYAVLSVRPSKRAERAFHIANACGSVPLAWLNYLAHTWPAVVVNLGFGLPAMYAVLREISRRRKERRDKDPWDGARPFAGIQIIKDPHCPPDTAYLINPDALCTDLIIWDDITSDEPMSDDAWNWYEDVLRANTQARIAVLHSPGAWRLLDA